METFDPALSAIGGVSIVALIIGLTAAAKRAGLRSQWAPLFALVVSLALRLGFEAGLGRGAWPEAVSQALAVGLAACGFYSAVKATVGGRGEPVAEE